jgi:cyanophycin synthetase
VEKAEHGRARVTWISRDPDSPVVRAHRKAGGRTVLACAGTVVLGEGDKEESLLGLERVPLTYGGGVAFQVENVLAATAAAWALGLSLDVIRAGLESFHGGQSPGRFNVFQADPTVIVDYAHNPSAVAAVVAALDQFHNQRRTLVYTGCNRRDPEVIEIGQTLGDAFDRVILYADHGHSGRADGELNGLLRRGLAAGKRVTEVTELPGEMGAVETALSSSGAGELVVLGIDSIEEVLALVQSRLVVAGERRGSSLPG